MVTSILVLESCGVKSYKRAGKVPEKLVFLTLVEDKIVAGAFLILQELIGAVILNLQKKIN